MDGTEVGVHSVRTVGTDTVALELETPDEFDAQPGQFVKLGAVVDGEMVTRYYTLSSPDVRDTFELTVGVDPDGDLSPWLAGLEPGDTVEIDGPFGRAYYEGDGPVVVLAGGPGVGPAVGIGERAHAEDQDVAIVYLDDDPAHEDRLSALADAGAAVFVVSEEFERAVVDALDAVDGRVFVYGFAEFVEAARDAIEAAGRDPDDAEIESFG